MLLKSFFYKALNKVCTADITRVLFLDRRTFTPLEAGEKIACRYLTKADLETLSSVNRFGIHDNFVKDFEKYRFLCIGAIVNSEIVGIIFLGSGTVPARHNSGGPAHHGIGVKTPKACFYMFKVNVLPEFRGRRVNPAMISFAFESLRPSMLQSIVTTTDWTNDAFYKSACRLGFIQRGHAAEFVFAGTHLYHLPKALDAANGDVRPHATEQDEDVIRFKGE
ncbi:MAG: hypothetical protein AB8B84_12025 [Granulosicoccus sp.]